MQGSLGRKGVAQKVDAPVQVVTKANVDAAHVGGLLSRERSGVRVMHLAEILAATERGPGASARSAEVSA